MRSVEGELRRPILAHMVRQAHHERGSGVPFVLSLSKDASGTGWGMPAHMVRQAHHERGSGVPFVLSLSKDASGTGWGMPAHMVRQAHHERGSGVPFVLSLSKDASGTGWGMPAHMVRQAHHERERMAIQDKRGPLPTLGACPRIRSWRRKTLRNNLLTAIWSLSWSN